MTERRQAEAWWDNHIDEYIKDLAGYVAFPSVAEEGRDGLPFGKPCLDMLLYMKDLMAEYGLETSLIKDVFASGVIRGEKKPIAIACHGDVVPASGEWDEDPFILYRKKDHLVGRGTTDNKGAGIAVLYAIRYLLESGYRFSHSVNLLIGSAEEIGMKDAAIAFPNGNGAILTLVPDSGFPVAYGEKASLKAEIRIPKTGSGILSIQGGSGVGVIDRATAILTDTSGLPDADDIIIDSDTVTAVGKARHSATPDEGVCALRKLLCYLDEQGLPDAGLKKVLSAFTDFHGTGFGLNISDAVEGPLTLVITECATDDDSFILTVNSRFPSSVDKTLITGKLGKMFDDVKILSSSSGFRMGLDDTLFKLNDLANDVYGTSKEPYVMAGGTYARVFQPAVAFGMGSPAGNAVPPFPQGQGRAHQRNESVQIGRMKNGFLIYTEALRLLDKELS
ncbi:MAG: M20/M25/M40 family metallo-hydrolase [Bullifex sp.]